MSGHLEHCNGDDSGDCCQCGSHSTRTPEQVRLKRRRYSYDSACFDLAESFLSDTALDLTTHVPELAEEIQRCIEDYIMLAEKCP